MNEVKDRRAALAGAFTASAEALQEKSVLLLDDLYRSGASMKGPPEPFSSRAQERFTLWRLLERGGTDEEGVHRRFPSNLEAQDQIRSKLAEIVDRELEILIGDANGADRAVQAQLAAWKYPRVSVYFVGLRPRNNVGYWPRLHVETPKGLKGFDFFSAKDKRMAREADCGLMLWDGESRGTLANVMNLVGEEKPVAVYVSKQRRFMNARTPADIDTLNAIWHASRVPSVAVATGP